MVNPMAAAPGNQMLLSVEEEAMLAGEAGPGVRQAMEIVVALGQIHGAADLVPIGSAQVSGVSYKNLGEAGLEFLQAWAAAGARVQVPTTLNPAGMDRAAWRQLGFSAGFARQQEAVIAAYVALGIKPTCTCTPYLIGHTPGFGQHLAWAESSAVSYANSALGARTNREGAQRLAAAIAGRTARYGLHLDQNRLATVVIDVRCPIRSETDLGALGFLIGQQVRNRVPFLRLEDSRLTAEELKMLGAAMAASSAVGLYHVAGQTPEAQAGPIVAPGADLLAIEDLAPAYAALDGDSAEIDLVSIGCPHASLSEIEAIAAHLDGRNVRAALWVTTAGHTPQG